MAASRPTPALLQPSAWTAKPMTNGKLPRVRLSIGTLKQLSIVQYFSESSSSRLRSDFIRTREKYLRGAELLRHYSPTRTATNQEKIMGRIYNNIVETVGRTPLVRLNRVTAGV